MASVAGENVEGDKREKAVVVAVDKCSRSSREALRWAIDHVVAKGQSVMLVHVDLTRSTALPQFGNNELQIRREPDEKLMDVLIPYICFCLMRQVKCEPVVLQHADVTAALREFISFYGAETFVLGGVTRHWITRIFRGADVHTQLENNIPSFCNMYSICNGRIMDSKSAALPFHPPNCRVAAEETISTERDTPNHEWSAPTSVPVSPSVSAPISRISSTVRPDEFSFQEFDISLIHSERPSTDSTFISFYKGLANRGFSSESMNKNMVMSYNNHLQNESLLLAARMTLQH
ncbi:hypothetical protein QQ045_003766 [Rhodiola kirilowii]